MGKSGPYLVYDRQTTKDEAIAILTATETTELYLCARCVYLAARAISTWRWQVPPRIYEIALKLYMEHRDDPPVRHTQH